MEDDDELDEKEEDEEIEDDDMANALAPVSGAVSSS